MRQFHYLFFLFLVSSCLLPHIGWSQNHWSDKINPEVRHALQSSDRAEVLVILKAQPDLANAKSLNTKQAKGQYVFEQCSAVAEQTQTPLLRVLDDRGFTYRSFSLVNAFYSQLDLLTIQRLAQEETVAKISFNPWAEMEQPVQDRTEWSDQPQGRETVEWGIAKIQADAVWDLGFRGEGIVVGGEDTGYDWQHPAIIQQYRGYSEENVDHNYHWHDAIHMISPLHNDSIVSPDNNPCGLDSPVPCDDNNHGTHTMGTMVGDDGEGNQIGVAPAAQWIGCRNMERGWGSPASYIECFEWFLAPTDLNDENPQPDLAPHVINNSWSCPEVEGCNPDNWHLMEMAIENLRAAGIVVVVSAGNSGPACETVSAPPAIFEASFSVGASRPNDTIAGFSSRGLVTVDSSFRLKPNVVAPGVQVRSAIRSGGYASFNGTSMAGPHVAGAVALMLSAAPQLAGQVEQIETLFEQTAVPLAAEDNCGVLGVDPVPNPAYGYGRIDVLAATQQALALVSTAEPTQQSLAEVYPNPSTGMVFINSSAQNVRFQLYDVQGKLLHVLTPSLNAISRLDLRQLPKGMYTYRLRAGDRVESGKLVVQ